MLNKLLNRIKQQGSHGLVVRTLDSESSNPSSSLGGTYNFMYFVSMKSQFGLVTPKEPIKQLIKISYWLQTFKNCFNRFPFNLYLFLYLPN
jgi:hypothetical protein